MLENVSMYDEILCAITARLDQMYNQEQGHVGIYTGCVRQGLQVPCFFVRFLEISQKDQINHQFCITLSVIIQYLAKEMETSKDNLVATIEQNKVAFDLYENLRILEVRQELKLRGMQMRHNVEGEILNFFVKYKCSARKPIDKKEPMSQLQIYMNKI